ncbi:MAG: EpsI family protein [Gemmataceae bacterium]|nr:EpsI family protein [Gemmataceae bacterium]
MRTRFPVLAGVALLLAGGLTHGLWTGRWTPSPRLAEARERLASLPADLGAWKGEDYERDPDELAAELALSGAVGHYVRVFREPGTGEKVLVMLLAGRPAQMAVHRPEDCYRAAGYEMAGPASKATVEATGAPAAEMFTGLFRRDDADGVSQMRIYWAWQGEDGWEAPRSPRFRFARQPVLYKLYVIRDVSGGDAAPQSDPCVALMAELLPALHKAINE